MKRHIGLAAVAIALALAGCGGGGGGAAGNSAAGSRSAVVPVFVTDSPETENDHIWVTLFKVEVQNAGGQSQTVFDDPAGHVVDLKSLHDAAGPRFAFLSNGAVSSGKHTGVRVTVGSNLMLFPIGSSAGQSVPLDDSIARDGLGHALVSFPLGTPRNLASGSDDLVVDFDLARFALRNGKLSPALREGDRSRLHDVNRQEHEDHDGVVANVSGAAPNFTFTLLRGAAATTVVTDATTVVFYSDAGSSSVLSNGQTVEVTGAFDTVADRIVATSVTIEDRPRHEAEAEVEGPPSAINAASSVFSVSTHKVRGFTPAQATLLVVTNSGTVLRSGGGGVLATADFFAALASAHSVKVEGIYNAAFNTLTASRAQIETSHGPSGGSGHEDGNSGGGQDDGNGHH